MTIKGVLIAVDPGDTSGIFIAELDGTPVLYGQMTLDEVIEFCDTYEREVAAVVLEDFTLQFRRSRQQSGSKMKASQAIGMFKVLAAKKHAKVIMQTIDNRDQGYRILGARQPGNHSESHWQDAKAHLAYRMHLMGLLQSKLEQERLNVT